MSRDDAKKPPNFREVEYKSCSECEYYTYSFRLEEGLCTKYDWGVGEILVQSCDDYEPRRCAYMRDAAILDDTPKKIEQLQTPPCFSDAECCLYCIHSVRIDSSNNFLKCEKYKIKCQGCIQPTRGPLVVLNQLAYPPMWNGNELLLDRFNQVFFPRFWSDKPHEVFRLLADEYAKEPIGRKKDEPR